MYCHRPERPGRRRERGVALIVALLVFAVCSALLVGLQRDFTLSYQRGANRMLDEQGWSYLRGAEALAAIALQLDHDNDVARNLARDDLTELWAQDATPYAIDEGGWIVGTLSDLQGRFNLNSLADQPQSEDGPARFTAAQQLFIRLLQSLEGVPLGEYEAIALTEAIGDWLDEDDNPRLNGAESAFYTARQPAYLPANGPMQSVSELRAVANVTPELFRALEPLVTVWPQEPQPINIHTAPPALLRALNVDGSLQPISEAEALNLAQRRAEGGFESRADLLELAQLEADDVSGLSSLLGEASNYFLLDARIAIADRQQRLYSVLRRNSGRVDILSRERAIPAATPLPMSNAPGAPRSP